MTDGDAGRALRDLATTLRVPQEELADLAGYDAAELTRLDELVRGAMEAEDQAFAGALEQSLGFLPRLARGAARRVLFPGGARG